jgi:hypothetical protein
VKSSWTKDKDFQGVLQAESVSGQVMQGPSINWEVLTLESKLGLCPGNTMDTAHFFLFQFATKMELGVVP